ncbi:hypothetical protein PF005_g30691 [Phytophthora fragariae]|uniref:Uncharacterized protein n=1 Tax=Phytophthora fragariae TaxID=53985 RepID=A0A6A3PW36_9STRA|nr:hypothetical protein PF003_g11190 [Phytophthora fragariae]KAE8931872.1 hypothetical protein PF009_g18078 [Phytophthora fragariae]KAE8997280.1 hypothetical protein PF011_g15548 [Phytophthora fragariae]KAE9060131.1 hypothetical protein PF010_g30340 [Phytophthora fragariae]KAE9061078.1 hypothetical protein PF007_g30384 [Phytophthora fragariae]
MSLAFETEQADEQFLAEVLAVLDVEEAEAVQEPPQPKLKRLRPRAKSDTTVKPKRIRTDSTPVESPRVRNKAKIELLRHEIKGLEAVLASLQSSKQMTAKLEWHRANSMWKIIAIRQSHERERAEHCNMDLKRMLFQQCALTRSPSSVLTLWDSLPVPDVSLSMCTNSVPLARGRTPYG